MRIFNAEASASTTSAAAQMDFNRRGGYRPVQAVVSATGTVRIIGRNAPDMAWVTLHEFTASGAENVLVMREMAGEITANSGTITLEIDV